MNKKQCNVDTGRKFKAARVLGGYESAKSFAEAILKTTGVNVNKDVMQRIESGRQGATLKQYEAAYETLYGKPPTLFRIE